MSLESVVESERMEKGIPNIGEKNAGVAILIWDKTAFKIKTISKEKGHYIRSWASIQEKDITIVNIYAPNTGAPQYIRQTLTDIKGETYKNTVIMGTLTAHLSQWTDWATKHTEHFIQKQQKTHSFHVHMEWSPKHIMC